MRVRAFLWRMTGTIFLLTLVAPGCDNAVNLLDFEGLKKYLDLTAAQTEVISGHVRRAVDDAEGYIRFFRERREELSRNQSSRVDDRALAQDSEVEARRAQTVERIRLIAADIRRELDPEQEKKFDRIVLPDLKQNIQELEFMMIQSRRGTFAALQVKPSSKIEMTPPSADVSDSLRYTRIKEQRTLVFGPGGFGSGLEFFPVFVTAILADSILTDAEGRYTAPADSMTGPDAKSRQASDMFTIRLVLSTFLHESYASPERWVLFIEDQDGNRFEPTAFIEEPEMMSPRPAPIVPAGYMAEGEVPLARKARQFSVRFPYQDPFGYEILGPKTRLLRLVLFDKNNPDNRTQGEWVFR